MNREYNDLRADFMKVLDEVSALIFMAYEQLSTVPEDHALAAFGLRDGREIVLEYLDNYEPTLAFEHLIYMIEEPSLVISSTSMAVLGQIAITLELPSPRMKT